MRFFVITALSGLILISTSLAVKAQENQAEKKNEGTLASMFETWNQEQKERAKKVAGVIDQEEQDALDTEKETFVLPPPSEIKIKGARSRIFDPVTSHLEQRQAYQQKNLDNYAKMDEGRENHKTSMTSKLDDINSGRDNHLQKAIKIDAAYDHQRKVHFYKNEANDYNYKQQQKIYLDKYISNHRKYLELDVEN